MKKVSVLVCVICLMVQLVPISPYAKTSEGVSAFSLTPTYVRARSHNGKQLKLIWKTVPKADGYHIYQYSGKKKKYRRVAEVQAPVTSWLSQKTKKLTKYKMRAYRYNESGEKQFGSFSYVVSAIAYNRKDKKVNAGTISVPHRFYNNELDLYETVQLQAKIKKSKYAKKNKKAKIVDSRLCWYTTDSSIATVDGNGLLKATGKTGECYVYARSHNGNSTGYMKVSVNNYARPEAFRNLEYVNEDMKRLLTTYAEDLKTVVEYFSIYNKTHTPQIGKFYLSQDRMRMIATSGIISYEPVQENLWRLMDQHPGHIQI
ncbi:MAG: hypothetical protein J1F02_11445 [Lachnospiraceae bacterium]|nr:hypothetical protein [Lachnospiraceae bacterium]